MNGFEPCPFCGNGNLHVVTAHRVPDTGLWAASCLCTLCPAGMSVTAYAMTDADDAIQKLWNMRDERTCCNTNSDLWGDDYSDELDGFSCSECGEELSGNEPRYCPNCGRRVVR